MNVWTSLRGISLALVMVGLGAGCVRGGGAGAQSFTPVRE